MSGSRMAMPGFPLELRLFLRRTRATPAAARQRDASLAIRRLRDELATGATDAFSQSSLGAASGAASAVSTSGAAAKFLSNVGVCDYASTTNGGRRVYFESLNFAGDETRSSAAVKRAEQDAVVALLRCGDGLDTAWRKVHQIMGMPTPTEQQPRCKGSATERFDSCALSVICDRLLHDMHLATSEPVHSATATSTWFRNAGRGGIWLPQYHSRHRAACNLLASGYPLASHLASQRHRASASALRAVLYFGALAADASLVDAALIGLVESGTPISANDLSHSMLGCSRGFDVERMENLLHLVSRRSGSFGGSGWTDVPDDRAPLWTRLTRVCCMANAALTVDAVSSAAVELQNIVSSDTFCPGTNDPIFGRLVAAAVSVVVAMARCHDGNRGGSLHQEAEQDSLLHCLVENCRSELMEHPAMIEACTKLFASRRDERVLSLAAHYLKRSNRACHSVSGLVDALSRSPSAADAVCNIETAFRRGMRLPPSVLNCAMLRDDLPVPYGRALLALNDARGVQNERCGTMACLWALRSLASLRCPSSAAVTSIITDLLSFLTKAPERMPHVVSSHQAVSLCVNLRAVATRAEGESTDLRSALTALDIVLLQGTETMELQWLVRRKCLSMMAFDSAVRNSSEVCLVDDAWIASLAGMCLPEAFCGAQLWLRLKEMSQNLVLWQNAADSRVVLLLLDQYCALDRCLRIAALRQPDVSLQEAHDAWARIQIADARLSAHVRFTVTYRGATGFSVTPNPSYVNGSVASPPMVPREVLLSAPLWDPCLPRDAFEEATEAAVRTPKAENTVAPGARIPASYGSLPPDCFVNEA